MPRVNQVGVLEYGESCSGGSQTITVNGPAHIAYVTMGYDAPVTATIALTLRSSITSNFDRVLRSVTLDSQKDAIWFPDGEFHLIEGESLDIAADSVSSHYSDIAVYGVEES